MFGIQVTAVMRVHFSSRMKSGPQRARRSHEGHEENRLDSCASLRRKLVLLWFFFLALASHAAYAQAWQVQDSHTTASLRGISAVSAKVAWASGTGGTYLRTVDGGEHWQAAVVPGAEQLDFRDIEAWDENTAILLSIGPGEKSRLYRTDDAGQHWRLLLQNQNPKAFWDCMAWWTEKHGIFVGDPVDQKFQIMTTSDGGEHWKEHWAKAKPGEGAFAASGTCVTAWTNGYAINDTQIRAAFVSGGTTARLFVSDDAGAHWNSKNIPMLSGTAGAGAFSVTSMSENDVGTLCCLVVGGAYDRPNEIQEDVARLVPTWPDDEQWSNIRGAWMTLKGPPPHGYRSCVAEVAPASRQYVAVGTNGSDYSRDGGDSWQPIDNENYNSVSFAQDGAGWAVGPKGKIAKWLKK